MGDYLTCNIDKCKSNLNGHVWVTRCLHAFCPEHGDHFFRNNKIQVNCPICNEANVRETDTILCQTNPNDMILAGLRPEKILRMLEKTVKLWKCQMEAERRCDSSKIFMMSKQIEETNNRTKQALHRKDVEYGSKIAALRANYNDLAIKLKQTIEELELVKTSYRKYKVAYESMINSRAPPGYKSPQRNMTNMSTPVFRLSSPSNDSHLLGFNPSFSNHHRF